MKINNRMPFVFVLGSYVVRAKTLPARIRTLPARARVAFWKTMRSPDVRPYVWVYYVFLWLWGIFGTFFAAPPTYVRPAMGPTIYDLWIWMNIIGTMTVMFGLRLEDKASQKTNPDLRKLWTTTAVRISTGGHASMFFVLLSYEMSAIYADFKGFQADEYSIFVTSPYVLGCLLLTAQGLVRVILGDEEEEQ